MLRQEYECGSIIRVQKEFQDQTMNVEVCKESRKNLKDQAIEKEG